MSNTNDFAVAIHEQRRRREHAQAEAARKQVVKPSDESRKVLPIEHMQKPEPIA